MDEWVPRSDTASSVLRSDAFAENAGGSRGEPESPHGCPTHLPNSYASIKCCHQDIVLCGHLPVDGCMHLPCHSLSSERKTGSLDTLPITHSTHRRFNAGDCVCTVHCLRHPFVRHQGVRARDSRIRCVRLHMSHTACSCTHTHSQQICTQPHADTHAHILCTSSMMKMLPSQLLMLARACSSCNLY